MDIFEKAVLLVIGGIGGAFLSKVFPLFFLEPIKKTRSIKGEVAKWVTKYANAFGELTSEQNNSSARQQFRTLAGRLKQCCSEVPFYPFWAFVRAVPSKEDIESAYSGLIGLSNCGRDQSSAMASDKYITKIEKALKL